MITKTKDQVMRIQINFRNDKNEDESRLTGNKSQIRMNLGHL